MERTKLEVVKSSLKPTDQIPNPQHLLITKLKELEPTIRACYDNSFDFDGDTLAWVIAIDALFLLHLLCSYNPGGSDNIDDEKRMFVQDIMMLENQIPLILVKKVQKAIHPPVKEVQEAIHPLSNFEPEIRAFCDAHSPLKLSAIDPWFDHYMDPAPLPLQMQIRTHPDARSPLALAQLDYSCHLLGFMYKVILHKEPEAYGAGPMVMAMAGTDIVAEAFRQLLSMAGLGLETLNLFTYLINFPWDTFFALFGKKSDEKKSPVRVKNITIPSASDLSRTGGVEFDLTYGVIADIHFYLRTPTFYLPMITLNVDSEVILRNLVAYESCLDTSEPHELADYIDLMSGIIHTAKDVELLREKEIVKGTLTNDEIVDLFNEISNSITRKPNQESYLEDTIDEVNQHFDSLLRVKARRLMKNCVAALWKLLVLLSAVFMLVLLGSNAFCEIFGCKNHLFK